jgi:cell division protein DivIC
MRMRRRYKNRTGIVVISFVVLILCGIVSYNRIGLDKKGARAETQIERLNAKIDKQKERKTEIENRKAYMQTDQYIEDVAREKLGLVYGDEIIFEPEE